MENGAPEIAAKITALDPKSITYQADVSALAAGIPSKVETATANVNGHSYLINSQTGEIIKDLGVANSEISSSGGGDKLLSPTEAATLGVPYGTTAAQAATMGITPQKSTSSLTAGQKDDLATMDTIKAMGQEVLDLGKKINWAGTGGFGVGSISQFLAKNVGIGKADEQELRNKISNIKSTLAKLRGGTALSVQEMAMLDAYVPTINDSPLVIESKINSFNSYIDQKKQALINVSSGISNNQSSNNNDPLGLR